MRRNLMRHTDGFSLLELLLVVTIIGVLGGVALGGFRGATQRARLSEASAQLTADFQRARSSAQRSNQNATLAFGTTTPATSYTLTLNGQASVRQLPAGVQVAVPAAARTVTYNAPFGETSLAAPAKYTLTSNRNPDLKRYLKIIGLTGKAYLSIYENPL